MVDTSKIIDSLFESFEDVRYAAIYKNNDLLFKQKKEVSNSSEAATDKYEELLVNPTLLTLAKQRGDIDCGGLNFIIVGYGNFYQLIKKTNDGHFSVCLKLKSDLNTLPSKIIDFLNTKLSIDL